MQAETIGTAAKIVVRSVAASFPGLGSLAAGWTEVESLIRERRLNSVISALEAEISRIREQISAIEAGDTARHAEFCQLLEMAVDRALREPEEAKIRELARAFVGVNRRDVLLQYDERRWLIDAVGELTLADIGVLRLFARTDYVQMNQLIPSGFPGHAAECEDILSRNFVSMKRLAARGIVAQQLATQGGLTTMPGLSEWVLPVLREAYRTTPFGRKVITILGAERA